MLEEPHGGPNQKGTIMGMDQAGAELGSGFAPVLSKSAFLAGLQCPKLLWYLFNDKDRVPPSDPQTEAALQQGREVGLLARSLFPGGIEIGQFQNHGLALRQTHQAIKSRLPMYEPALQSNGGFARIDVLNPVGKDQWDLVEVKSSTSVKDEHVPDVAFQSHVCAGAGLIIRNCWLVHVSRDFVKSGSIDPRQFFTQEDLSQSVSAMAPEIQPQLDRMMVTIRQKSPPHSPIGPHCDNPHPCPLHDECWKHLPEDSVTTLYRGKEKGFKLLAKGITAIRDIPSDYELNEKQTIQRTAAINGKPQVDREAIRSFLARVKYPAFFLDFETFATALPMFDGVRPYQQIPFQFSLHILRSVDSQPEHHMFLAEGREDPRPEILRRLRNLLEERGSVVAYNAGFEQKVLAESGDAYPEFKSWVATLQRRFMDLLEPFRAFAYYHSAQDGSASMKAVLPALTGKGYGHLEIQDGSAASREYLRVTYGEVSAHERRKVRAQLEAYCGQDTEGMLWIFNALTQATINGNI